LLQVYLISIGSTTYEQFKRNAVYREMRQLAAAHAALQAAHTSTSHVQPGLQPHAAAAAAATGMAPGDAMQQHDEPLQQQQGTDAQSLQKQSGRSWLPWARGRKGGVVCQKAPPPYDRGFKQNWLEVLFPELILQQEELRQQQQGMLRGQGGGQRGRQQQREGAGGSVSEQQQQQSTARPQTGNVGAERKQQ
jgi:hypothetical protein